MFVTLAYQEPSRTRIDQIDTKMNQMNLTVQNIGWNGETK